MNFSFSERENFLVKTGSDIARDLLFFRETLRPKGFPKALWKKRADTGLPGMPVGTRFGGPGLNAKETALSFYGFSQIWTDNGFAFSLAAHTCAGLIPLVQHASPKLQKRILPKVVKGNFILANAMTETQSGSNAFGLRTTATKTANGYRLNGAKVFCTNAPVADGIVVYALTDEQKGFFGGISCFLLEKKKHNFSVGPAIPKTGLHASPMAEVFFSDVFVEEENRIGSEGTGAMIFLESMNWERANIAALHAGTMQRLIRRAVEYVKQRHTGKTTLSDLQAVQFRLADMAVLAETSLLLALNAADAIDTKKDALTAAAKAKIFVSEALAKVAAEAVYLHGANGFTEAYGLGREIADAQAAAVYSGPNDVLRELIASRLQSR